MTPVAAMTALGLFTAKVPRRMRNSPTNPFRPGRPMEERVKIISALDVVDYVVIFSTDKLNELLKTIKPDILTKGSNYSTDEVIGHQIVEELGGQVIVIPVSNNITTSRIIDSIKGTEPK